MAQLHNKGTFDSWTIVSEKRAIKITDKSFFDHQESEIPAEIRWFFNAEDLRIGDKKSINLFYEGKVYSASITVDQSEPGKTIIRWPVELGGMFSNYNVAQGISPSAVFEKFFEDSYGITIQPGKKATYKKYSVNTAVWLAAALLSMEKYERNAATPAEGFYFKQTEIQERARTLATGEVHNARCSMHCCADHAGNTHNYLRGNLSGYPSLRRLTRMDEFKSKTYPTDLSETDIVPMNGRDITIGDLFNFVRNDYLKVEHKMSTDINYIGVLDYLNNNQDIPYSNPNSPGLDPDEQNRLLEVKQKGQNAANELKKMAGLCAKSFGLNKCLSISWLDGSNTKTRKYLWAQMKYEQYSQNPTSISIFVEKSHGETYYRISLEIKNDGTDISTMLQYHSHLDIPVENGLVYASGSNEWGVPIVLKESQAEIQKKVKHGDLKKVQLCSYIENKQKMTNDDYEHALLKSVEKLIPYYNHVIGKNKASAINSEEEEKTIMEQNKCEFSPNMILYGPPGTGKTYNTAIYAVAICDGLPLPEVRSWDYEDVMDRYRELKAEKRVEFTTFHQSYGYEEFIEGIRPVVDDESSNVTYTIEPGVFKRFCSLASKKTVASKGTLPDMEGARIWSVLLDGTGVSKLKTECFASNCIRIGWPKSALEPYVTKRVSIDAPYTQETPQLSGTEQRILHNFEDEMGIGDLVVTERSNHSIDGIGVITGDYEYDQTNVDFPRKRTVQWLMKEQEIEFMDINGGKHLDRKTVYELNRVQINQILSLLSENEAMPVEQENRPFVFIVDEINRGNISKIFGELITLIEDTKRGGCAEEASAILPYSGEEFSVPKNVYILGTMNTADRSIALMDTALRRRFQFVEMMPNSQILTAIHADKVGTLDVARMLDVINQRIIFLYDREHTIGHAFFTKLAQDPTVECLASIFRKSVIPLLQEYFYEDYQKIQLVLGDNGKADPTHKFILDEEVKVKEIFKGNADDVVDLPDKKFSINEVAFDKLESYLEIM